MGTHINPELPDNAHSALRELADKWGLSWARLLAAAAADPPGEAALLASLHADNDADALEAAREAVESGGGPGGPPTTDGGPNGGKAAAPDNWRDGYDEATVAAAEAAVEELARSGDAEGEGHLSACLMGSGPSWSDRVAVALDAHPDVEQVAGGKWAYRDATD